VVVGDLGEVVLVVFDLDDLLQGVVGDDAAVRAA